MNIPLSVYAPPHGKIGVVNVVLPERLQEKWEKIKALGCRFTIEYLRSPKVSLCIEHSDAGDVAIELFTLNSITPEQEPVVASNMEKLIIEFELERIARYIREVL